MNILFSFQHIKTSLQATLQRFPLVLFVSLIATACAFTLILADEPSAFAKHFSLTVFLALPLSLAGSLLTEQLVSEKKKVLILCGSLIVLVAHYISLATKYFDVEHSLYSTHYGIWLLIIILFIMVVPFLKKESSSLVFWKYNKKMIYGFLIAGIYTGLLYGGLMIALVSVDALFNTSLLDGDVALLLWFGLLGVFGVTFFLSRFPQNAQLEMDAPYPKELKILTHYILAPLLGIYFLILYTYTAKILTLWEWPRGVVSSMILGFSAFGILLYAMLAPLVAESLLLQKIRRIFFILLIPQIFILFMAIWMRVSEYGVTESRYVLIVLGLWLLGMALYFLFSTTKHIRIIPLSLCVLALLTSFGPWGMFAVSEASQVKRLERIFESKGVIVDGKFDINKKVIFTEDENANVVSIERYLEKRHDLKKVEVWFSEKELAVLRSSECVSYSESLCALFDSSYAQYSQEEMISIYTENSNSAVVVSGYDYYIENPYSLNEINTDMYAFNFDEKTFLYTVTKNGTVVASIPLQTFFNSLFEQYRNGKKDFAPEELMSVYENESIKIKIHFYSITYQPNNFYTNESILFTLI